MMIDDNGEGDSDDDDDVDDDGDGDNGSRLKEVWKYEQIFWCFLFKIS